MVDLALQAERIATADAVLFDWDGCLAFGGRLLPGAREILTAYQDRAWILSNNSTALPQDLHLFLAEAGVRLPTDRILLAGHFALCRQAVRSQARPVHLVANPRMRTFAQDLGLTLSPGDAETVMLLRDTGFTFAKLQAAADAARRCGRIVLANPDLTHPAPDDGLAPETGALFAAVEACLDGAPVAVDLVGKPGPALFTAALERARVEPRQAVMIGDNPDTDGAGAAACGATFLQVAPTGSATLAAFANRLGLMRPAAVRPSPV